MSGEEVDCGVKGGAMIPIQFFPYSVAALEAAAGLVYLWHHEWRLAIVWFGVAVANGAFAGIK